MRSLPKLRGSLKWFGAAASLLLLSLWLMSLWKIIYWWDGSGSNATITRGYLGIVYGQHIPLSNIFNSSHWTISQSPPVPSVWSFNLSIANRFLIIPLWAPFILSFMFTLLAWQRDRALSLRARQRVCPHCNYNLSGLPPTAKCPECGSI